MVEYTIPLTEENLRLRACYGSKKYFAEKLLEKIAEETILRFGDPTRRFSFDTRTIKLITPEFPFGGNIGIIPELRKGFLANASKDQSVPQQDNPSNSFEDLKTLISTYQQQNFAYIGESNIYLMMPGLFTKPKNLIINIELNERTPNFLHATDMKIKIDMNTKSNTEFPQEKLYQIADDVMQAYWRL